MACVNTGNTWKSRVQSVCTPTSTWSWTVQSTSYKLEHHPLGQSRAHCPGTLPQGKDPGQTQHSPRPSSAPWTGTPRHPPMASSEGPSLARCSGNTAGWCPPCAPPESSLPPSFLMPLAGGTHPQHCPQQRPVPVLPGTQGVPSVSLISEAPNPNRGGAGEGMGQVTVSVLCGYKAVRGWGRLTSWSPLIPSIPYSPRLPCTAAQPETDPGGLQLTRHTDVPQLGPN